MNRPRGVRLGRFEGRLGIALAAGLLGVSCLPALSPRVDFAPAAAENVAGSSLSAGSAFSPEALARADAILSQPLATPEPVQPIVIPDRLVHDEPPPPPPAVEPAPVVESIADMSPARAERDELGPAAGAAPPLGPVAAPAEPPAAPWLIVIRPLDVYRTWYSDEVAVRLPPGAYLRVEGPDQRGRLWVSAPLVNARGWVLPRDVASWPAPSVGEQYGQPVPPDPRLYLYRRWPDTARRMDCVIWYESGWNSRALNARSGAAGFAQFLASTWARTPYGRAGYSPYDPYAAIDAFGWMVHGGGSWSEWEVVHAGFC